MCGKGDGGGTGLKSGGDSGVAGDGCGGDNGAVGGGGVGEGGCCCYASPQLSIFCWTIEYN